MLSFTRYPKNPVFFKQIFCFRPFYNNSAHKTRNQWKLFLEYLKKKRRNLRSIDNYRHKGARKTKCGENFVSEKSYRCLKKKCFFTAKPLSKLKMDISCTCISFRFQGIRYQGETGRDSVALVQVQ